MCDTVVIHTVGGFGSCAFDVSFDDAFDNGRGHRQCGSGQCHVYSLRSAHGYARLELASPDRILARIIMGRPQTVCVRIMSCIQIGKFTHTDLRFLMSRVMMAGGRFLRCTLRMFDMTRLCV